jgi:hypothetical protein
MSANRDSLQQNPFNYPANKQSAQPTGFLARF